MKVRLYTDEEIKVLKQNIFVNSVKYKREIEYNPIFKLWAIMMKYEFPELSAREIFARGGFDINMLHKKLPQRRIKDWMEIYQKFGIKYFLSENNCYYSLKHSKDDDEEKVDIMKTKLFYYILKRFKENNFYDNR